MIFELARGRKFSCEQNRVFMSRNCKSDSCPLYRNLMSASRANICFKNIEFPRGNSVSAESSPTETLYTLFKYIGGSATNHRTAFVIEH